MKTLFYQVMAIALLLPLFQCERTEIEPVQTQTNQIDYDENQEEEEFVYAPELETYSVPKNEVRTKIRSYLNAGNSRTDYSIQEAVWYIEGLPNYFEGNANVSYKKLAVTEHYYYVGNDVNTTFSNEKIDEFVADIRRQTVVDKAAAPCGDNEKNTILINISPVRNNNGEIYLKATVGTGVQCDSPPTEEDTEPYIEYDPCDLSLSPFHWHATGTAGTCGEGLQSNVYDNAAEVIETVINSFDADINSCPMRYAFPTENGFFANIFNSPKIDAFAPFPNVFQNPDDAILNDGYRDYWLLTSSSNESLPVADCLDPDEMEYYRSGAYSVIYWFMNNGSDYGFNTDGKSFAMCDMSYVSLFVLGDANALHNIIISYGDYIP